MLLTILARLSNDEQRLQLLQTLRTKLTNYNLDWFDIKNIINLFSTKEQTRYNVLKFLLSNISHILKPISIDDYIHLSNQCTNENEQLRFVLFEQIHEKLSMKNKYDIERIINLFQTTSLRQKVEMKLQIHQSDFIDDNLQEVIGDQQSSFIQSPTHLQQIITHHCLSPTMSHTEELSLAPLKRTCSFDETYQEHDCRKIIAPSLIREQDEFIQIQRDLLPIVSRSSSSDSSLSSSASDEFIPTRTRSFMVAIKNTFERLRETSS